MLREETVEEISDGRLYTANDMVRVGTNDCSGCSDCCRMGPVIVLDPLDVFELNRFLGRSFEELLNDTIELKVIDGLILPVLKLVKDSSHEKTPSKVPQGSGSSETLSCNAQGNPLSAAGDTSDEAMVCPYLGDDGRCSIHDFRPGICRLYPLGRSWENGDFHYILQVNECTRPAVTKMKVRKWLGIPGLSAYEDFCRSWHSVLEKTRLLLEGTEPDSALRRRVCIYILRQFYMCDWNVDDFYSTFEARRGEAMGKLGFAQPARGTSAGLPAEDFGLL
ncbi:MAG: YkgJ family cysteine cluster protein [Lachnospiraceae bacterium]|nr:YkgJ family cysteine cluster protein [Lachnospiraceae bacterium]